VNRFGQRIVICTSVLLAITVAPMASAAISNPTVTGPIPSDALGSDSHNYPFFATNLNLSSYGYVEEEFFLEGTASNFNTSNTANATVRSTGNPYKIRILVRRPISSSKFNGVVLVDWMNVTNNFEFDTEWPRAYRYIMRTGAIYVGAGVQRIGQVGSGTPNLGLKAWSPARYGTLDVTVGGTLNDDSLRFDIWSQVAKALRSPVGTDPLVGMRPAVLIATGDSQSASNLATYANSVHPLEPIYDAFLTLGNLGTNIRTDITTKYFKVNSEYDVIQSDAGTRRADTNKFVTWEVAGASHSDYWNWIYGAPIRYRDLAEYGYVHAPPNNPACRLPSRTQVDYYKVIHAAYDHTVRWVTQGIQPPSAPPIQVTTTNPRRAVRNSYGIALGGIRLYGEDVPIGFNAGWQFGVAAAANTSCQQNGTYIDFLQHDRQTVVFPISATVSETYTLPSLDELYPAGQPIPESYGMKVLNSNMQNFLKGYILKPDMFVFEDASQRDQITHE